MFHVVVPEGAGVGEDFFLRMSAVTPFESAQSQNEPLSLRDNCDAVLFNQRKPNANFLIFLLWLFVAGFSVFLLFVIVFPPHIPNSTNEF